MKHYYSCVRAYDRAAIKFRGVEADINFNLSDYDDMKQVSFLVFILINLSDLISRWHRK